jgi:hypothetical protein
MGPLERLVKIPRNFNYSKCDQHSASKGWREAGPIICLSCLCNFSPNAFHNVHMGRTDGPLCMYKRFPTTKLVFGHVLFHPAVFVKKIRISPLFITYIKILPARMA